MKKLEKTSKTKNRIESFRFSCLCWRGQVNLITKLTAVSPSDEGKDIWEKCLSLFFCGDHELIDYVQFVVGLAAVGKVYQEHLIIAYGGGANGKSTFWNTVARVLGTYSGKLSAETLTVGCKRNVKPEMAELKGKRLIISSEMEEGMRLNTAVVKQLCSTDEIFAEKKYKAPFAFTPSHTLVLYTNHLPKVGANDDSGMSKVAAISGAAGDDLDALSKKATPCSAAREPSSPRKLCAGSWLEMGLRKARLDFLQSGCPMIHFS